MQTYNLRDVELVPHRCYQIVHEGPYLRGVLFDQRDVDPGVGELLLLCAYEQARVFPEDARKVFLYETDDVIIEVPYPEAA